MTEKRVVVVSRKLVVGEPINVKINVLPDEDGIPEIALAISLTDFLSALVQEAGNPATLLTQAQLAKRLSVASDVVLENLKAESARVM